MLLKISPLGRLVSAAIFVTVMVALAAFGSVAGAATSLYRYDAPGRLRTACNAIPGQAYRTDYTLDASDNRSAYANIKTDFVLFADTGFFWNNNRFQLRMQSDGNLVVYQMTPTLVALWSSNTVGGGATAAYLQSDGNFVLYKANGSYGGYNSLTYMHPCARLELWNDGNVVIRNIDDVVVWQTNTGGH